MIIGAILLASGLIFSAKDASLAYDKARELVETCTPRDAGTIRGRIASNFILDNASAVGADVRRDVFRAQTPKGEKEFTNLYADFKCEDESARWVVVVSHYDTKSGVRTPGANDGASTTGLLIGLANAMSYWEKPHGNLMLVWTDGEECMNAYGANDGFWGSKRAAEYLLEKGRKVQAVICVDMLGDRDLQITVPSNGSESLRKLALHAAKRAGYPDLVKLSDEVIKDDHMAFMDRGFKAIDLIDFTYGPDNSYWHTSKDTIENISEESLLKSGKVVAELINILL